VAEELSHRRDACAADLARRPHRALSARRKPRTGQVLDLYGAPEMPAFHVDRYESVRIARDVDLKNELAKNNDASVAMSLTTLDMDAT
jgi:hypothetical protein